MSDKPAHKPDCICVVCETARQDGRDHTDRADRPMASNVFEKLDQIEADLAHLVAEFNVDQSYEAAAVAQAALVAVNTIKGVDVDLESWLWDPT